jgi:hypothetical protein
MAAVAKWLTHRIVAPAFVGSIPTGRPICGSGSGVEHRLAKARVAGSNPVFRSKQTDNQAKAASDLNLAVFYFAKKDVSGLFAYFFINYKLNQFYPILRRKLKKDVEN